MNILPKKRWHVRTKENVARVRKDIAEAAEQEKAKQTRIQNADREARLNVLRAEASKNLISYEAFQISQPDTTNHDTKINELEAQTGFIGAPTTEAKTNKLHDKEIKDAKEDYEKKIGYLTYLGQETNEILGKKNWYEVLPEHIRGPHRSENIKDSYDKLILKGKVQNSKLDKTDEVQWQTKQTQDPIHKFKKINMDFKTNPKLKTCQLTDSTDDYKSVLGHHSKAVHEIKQKKHKYKRAKRECDSHKDSSERKKEEAKLQKLKELRKLRLKREEEEKRKTTLFLNCLSGIPEKSNNISETKTVNQKYNSQFNPDIARQNFK